MGDATPARVWLVAQTRRRLVRLALDQARRPVACGRPERPAWSEPSPDAPRHDMDHLTTGAFERDDEIGGERRLARDPIVGKGVLER